MSPSPASLPTPQSTEAKQAPEGQGYHAPSSGGPGSGGPGFRSAIAYTPYSADNSCKSTSQVAMDLEKLAGWEIVRLYGTDCNQISNVIAATHSRVQLFLGIYDINSVQSEVQTMSSAINGDWSLVQAVAVGNEQVNRGSASVAQVTAAIETARSSLKAAGYHGPVVTVDTMTAMKNNPALCTASNFCAINCNAFFDGKTLPQDAGDFVAGWVKQVSEAAGGKTTIVTESGWPTQGDTNDLAMPSPENQALAMASLKKAFNGGTDIILFNSYNDAWKKDTEGTFHAEKYWGIMGDSPG